MGNHACHSIFSSQVCYSHLRMAESDSGLDQPPGAPQGQMPGWSVKASVGGTF